MTQYLFLIGIGPVQEFIASARRSRDLWFGSWLLSELAKAAAYYIHTHDGELIFPSPTDPHAELAPNSQFDVGNEIMAVVTVADVQDFRTQLEKVVRERLAVISATTFHRVGNGKQNGFDRPTAERQVADLVECYSVALPLAGESSYAAVRSHLKALMGARKVTRNFSPVAWGATLPKSSLDGQRESVISETDYPARNDSPQVREQKIQALYTSYGAGQAERLSGVDMLKRNGTVERHIHGKPASESRFMSTSHVAALPLLQQLAQRADTARDAWDRYLTELRSSAVRRTLIEQERIAWKYPPHPVIADYDGSLLFEERLDDVLAGAPPGDIQGAKGALRDFLRATLQEGTSPLPYYALLHADGDNMGKVIDAIDTLERHQELSRNLSIFAGKVRTIVENDHAGALIYAGGDDVLALVPLHTALPCADHLARTFYEQLQQFTAPNDEKTGTISPTLSVGIAVWHHIEPLADALDLVRQAEKQAKDVHRKNALAVTLSKRSGADRTVAGSWGNPDTTDQQAAWGTLYQRLLTFVELHRREAFPDGAAYELHDLYLRVGHTLPPAALQAEAMRMLQRKRAQKGITGIDAPMLEQIAQVVSQPDMTLEQLANEIIIARIFADADRLAYPDKVQPATLDTKEQS